MSEKISGRYVCAEKVRMAFGNLTEPRVVGKRGAAGTPKYSGTFVFDKDSPDLKKLKEVALSVMKAQWPGRPPSEVKFPFADGTKKIEQEVKKAEREKRAPKKMDFFENKVVFSARSKFPVQLCQLVNGSVVPFEGPDLAKAAKLFYNGCYVVPAVNFVPYEGQAQDGFGNPDGVTAYLEAVMFIEDGERIGGGKTPAETFSGWAGSVSDEDPGLDDEIAF